MQIMNKKDLRKSLLHWKKEYKSLVAALVKVPSDNVFMFDHLTMKKLEAEVAIKSIEKVMGINNEE